MQHALHLSAALAAAWLLAAPAARAHGAFPKVLQAAADPSDPSRLWVRATHGVLTSTDAGKSWYWLCTAAAGYGPTEEPPLAVTKNGTVLLGTFNGLYASSDHGCGWAFPTGVLGSSVTGLAVDEKNPSRVVVLLSRGASGGKFESELWQSLDAGASWASVPTSLDPATLHLSVGISASDPARLYLTGLPGAGGGKSVVLRSSDSGQSWESADLPGAPGAAGQIVGVHPTNPDVLYVRANLTSSTPSEGALFASSDGAQSFSQVLKQAAPLMGFTLSPDGSEAFAAYGNPRGGVVVVEAELGLYSAKVADNAFARVLEGPVACASFIAGELWACTSQFDQGFELGRSSDGGKTFTPVMELAGITGPLECPAASTVGSVCSSTDFDWEDVCRDIGKCGFGTGGQGNAGGEDGGGCGCRSTSRGANGSLGLLALAALGLGRRRGRRPADRAASSTCSWSASASRRSSPPGPRKMKACGSR